MKQHSPSVAAATPEQRKRRKIAREIGAMYDDIARECGFTPAERKTAWAITVRIYEIVGQNCDAACGISLASIGKALTSRSDNEEACAATARRNVSDLFTQSIPRAGYQILTRYKSEEDSGRPHEYVDHLMPIAAFFSELFAEEIKIILSDKNLDRKARAEAINTARERLITESLGYLPRC